MNWVNCFKLREINRCGTRKAYTLVLFENLVGLFRRAHPKWVPWFSGRLHISAAGSPLTLFSCFQSRVTSKIFLSVFFFFSQSELDARFLLIYFYVYVGSLLLLWPGFREPTVHLSMRFALIIVPLSLSLLLSRISFSYMCLLFCCLLIEIKILVGNNVLLKQSPESLITDSLRIHDVDINPK